MLQIGAVTYTLLCGYEPFFGRDEAELTLANKECCFDFESKEWKHVSWEAKDFITQSLCANPKKRMGVDKARAHPWLVSVASRCPLPHSDRPGGGLGLGQGVHSEDLGGSGRAPGCTVM